MEDVTYHIVVTTFENTFSVFTRLLHTFMINSIQIYEHIAMNLVFSRASLRDKKLS